MISETLGKFSYTCVFFIITMLVEKIKKCLGGFLLVPYCQNMIEWMPLTRGYTPYFILGSNIFFPSCYSSF